MRPSAEEIAAYHEVLEMLQRGISRRKRTKPMLFRYFYVTRTAMFKPR